MQIEIKENKKTEKNFGIKIENLDFDLNQHQSIIDCNKKNYLNVYSVLKNLASSLVENILTRDCFLNVSSFDQIGKSNFKANAKNSVSLECGASFKPSANLSEYLPLLNISKSYSSNSIANSAFSSFTPLFFSISPPCFLTSSSNFSGPMGLNLPENNKLCTISFVINAARTLLVSTTIDFIYINPLLSRSLNIDSFIFLPSSSASFSLNLLSDISALNSKCLNLRDFLSSSSNTFNLIASIATCDQFSGSSLISLSSFSGISTFNSGILTSPNNKYCLFYKSFGSDFQLANLSNETGSFNWSLSQTTWANIPPVTGSAIAIALLNYTATNNSAEVEILVRVPVDEPGGLKESTVNFRGELASSTL